MGDRINLRFVSNVEWENQPSPVLYAHWDGEMLLTHAHEFWCKYKGKIRTEPSNWMVNFVHWLRTDVYDGGHYLYPSFETASCASDNGNWEFNTVTGEYYQVESK